jgi:hypothetical protein
MSHFDNFPFPNLLTEQEEEMTEQTEITEQTEKSEKISVCSVISSSQHHHKTRCRQEI